MKIWKVAALVALATIPLLIIGKKRKEQPKGLRPESGDSDDIFEYDLNAD
jgi:hypothetical protein